MQISDLLALDVSKFTEKKGSLSYLSWSHAWAEALKADPAANFHVETFQRADGATVPYMEINGYAMVWVRVTMFGKEVRCFLPVMNSKNDPITIARRNYKDKYGKEAFEEIDAFNVNTAIMRCMTKALALHGLGLNIYAGEDLPMISDGTAEPAKEKTPEEDPFDLGTPKVEAPTPAASTRETSELFADAMIQFLDVCTTSKGLSSYWSSNQEKIDKLKSDHLDLYTKVRDAFSVMKAKLKEQEAKLKEKEEK